ncbi:MAG: heat-inducible transcriptional repressor HrcA [Rhodothermia bacterium]
MRHTYSLTDRERMILRLVVNRFVGTGDPVGSRSLSRFYDIGLSPASIRNTMSDLEDGGYLGHPHTSSGRVPTDFGYRAYVDELMDVESLSRKERSLLSEGVSQAPPEILELMHESARILGQMSNLLGVALSPRFATAVFRRLDIVPVTSTRAMFVVTVESGLAKTLILEVEGEIESEQIASVVALLNERLSGLTFREIRNTAAERVRGTDDADLDLVSFVLKRASVIFSDPPERRRMAYSGAGFILSQPEFSETDRVRHIIEFLESGEAVVSTLEEAQNDDDEGRIVIRIGSENTADDLSEYSVVAARYSLGQVTGSIGLIGPTRMNYGRAVGLVEGMAAAISRYFV